MASRPRRRRPHSLGSAVTSFVPGAAAVAYPAAPGAPAAAGDFSVPPWTPPRSSPAELDSRSARALCSPSVCSLHTVPGCCDADRRTTLPSRAGVRHRRLP
jgi:hypothetical protein